MKSKKKWLWTCILCFGGGILFVLGLVIYHLTTERLLQIGSLVHEAINNIVAGEPNRKVIFGPELEMAIKNGDDFKHEFKIDVRRGDINDPGAGDADYTVLVHVTHGTVVLRTKIGPNQQINILGYLWNK